MKFTEQSLRSSERVEPEEFSQKVSSKLGEGAEIEVSYGQVIVRLSPERALDALSILKSDPDLDCNYFTFLSAIDWQDDGFEVLIALFSTVHLNTVILKIKLPKDSPHMPSVTPLYRGANWHERECAEMFGIVFDGHPNPKNLYLSDDFVGHPLRKDFRLASRTFKPWPGAKDPGEAGGR
ncbi:MAG: NADH-quinone oxidoreductase subunit C [Actinomycetota bacterium]